MARQDLGAAARAGRGRDNDRGELPRTLASLGPDLLAPSQYAKNVQTHPESRERVEFAIRTPGPIVDGAPCWIPIDAKFPLQDWERLQEALERADIGSAEGARKALCEFIRLQARTIREKYIRPPYTTEFAILFLPAEALYAELLSRAGFADGLQRDFRVVLAGPIVDNLSFHYLFWLPLIPTVIATALIHVFVPESPVRVPGTRQGIRRLSGRDWRQGRAVVRAVPPP